jgi:hypothetical protein
MGGDLECVRWNPAESERAEVFLARDEHERDYRVLDLGLHADKARTLVTKSRIFK